MPIVQDGSRGVMLVTSQMRVSTSAQRNELEPQVVDFADAERNADLFTTADSAKATTPHIAIVVPVYREERNLLALYQRLEEVTSKLPEYTWEYVFVNDGSPDRSYDVLKEIAKWDTKVKLIDLSRNFGKEIALTAGVHAAQGDAVICMDADLQHPPEVIPELIKQWRDGAEVVSTIRVSIERQPWLRQVGSWLFYWIMGKISGLDMAARTTDFRLVDRKVVDAFKTITERERMFRGIIDWLGFRKTYVEFKAPAREEGEAGYTYHKLVNLAVSSITSFSLFPLRVAGYVGLLITSLSGLLATWMLASYLFDIGQHYTPLAIVVVMNTFLIGIVLMALGLVALYVGSIHTEVINRPLYVVREKFNCETKTEAR